MRTQAPKYSTKWDPEPVLVYLATLHHNEDISIEQLTKKLVTLLALIKAQRVQNSGKISLENITTSRENLIQSKIPERLKTSGRNKC